MIKILYALNGIFARGGTEAVVMNYYNNIDKSKFHIDFLLHGSSEDGKNNPVCRYLTECGSKIFYVTPRGINYRANLREMKAVLKQNKYDIVHSHMDSAGMFFLKEAKKAGVRVRVAHSHNTGQPVKSGNLLKRTVHRMILFYARRRINHYATLRLACSRMAGEWLFGKNKFTVINNAIDLEKFKYNEQIRNEYREKMNISDKFVIGHVGRFAYQKNHEYLIDIFNELLKTKKDSVLLLVGEGELKPHIEEKVKSLGIEENVLFLGGRDDVSSLMQAMDLFLFPSHFEGLGVVLIEAQASGLVCVVSDGIPTEPFILQKNKQISLKDSPEAWATNIVSLALPDNRDDAYIQVKKAGYDISDIIAQLETHYSNAYKELAE